MASVVVAVLRHGFTSLCLAVNSSNTFFLQSNNFKYFQAIKSDSLPSEALGSTEAPVWEGVCIVFVVLEGPVVCLSSWSRIISMMPVAVYFDLPE